MIGYFTPEQVKKILWEVEASLFQLSGYGYLRHKVRTHISTGHGNRILLLDPKIFDPHKYYICTHVRFPAFGYIYAADDFYDILKPILEGIRHVN
ncbi:hypothetical protein ES703_28181 [subsurface metagenome]